MKKKPLLETAKSPQKVSSRSHLGEHVPRLRFPGFDEDWGGRKFGSVFDFIPNNTLARSELVATNGKVRNIHYGDILVKFGSVVDVRSDEIPFIANQDSAAFSRCLKDGDVIIADTAEDETVGKAAELIGLDGAEVEAGLHTIACRPRENFAPRFLGYCLNSSEYHRRLMPLMQGIKVLSLSKSQISGTEFFIPRQKFEQEKIASFLSLVDSRIDKLRRLIDLLKKHNRGVVEQLFGRRLTMGKPVAWTTKRLRDLFTKVARRNKNCAVKNVITNSAEHGLIPQRDFFDKDIAVDGNTGAYYVIRTGDFVYNPRKSTTAPFGPFNRYTGTDDGIISPLYTCLVPNGGADPEYLAWYFRSTAWHRYVYDNGSQGARHDRVNMTDDLLFGIPILLPDLQSQKRIANALNELDARSTAAQSVLERLLDMKRGLLQQLFV